MRDDSLPKQKSIVRVRTGCGTCKIRKVKCDEGKPECRRCVSTGRKCDGYTVSAAKSNAHQTTSFYSIPFRVPGSQHDRQMLHYYCNHAANDLSAYPTGSFNFWVTLVLQRARDQPVLYNPLIALASIHLDHVNDEQKFSEAVSEPSPKTIDAYVKSVRQLRKYMSNRNGQDPVVVIICCVLLSCFESGRGQREWAFRHLQAALTIFKRHSAEKFPEALTYTLRCLDIQMSVFDVGKIPVLPLAPEDDPVTAVQQVPTDFTSHQSVSWALRQITQIVMQFLALCSPYRSSKHEDWPEHLLEQSRTITHIICEHRRAFNVYVNLYYRGSGEDVEADFCIALFAIWHKLCGLILSTNWDIISMGCYVTWSQHFQQTLDELGGMFRCDKLDLRMHTTKTLRSKIATYDELMDDALIADGGGDGVPSNDSFQDPLVAA